MSFNAKIWIGALAALQVMAQDPAIMPEATKPGDVAAQTVDATPRTILTTAPPQQNQAVDKALQQSQNEKLDNEVRAAKAKDIGPIRFAADLFDTRQYGINPTEGGISRDYVLGVGDRLQMNVFGSATFDLPLQVDGRGEVVIPKVGTVSVAGMSLDRARAAVQSKVAQIFSRSTVDLSVTELREVRVFVLGEVYKPGSYLVPSLSSIVNILSLSGGPTSVGSYRDIRVIRGGHLIHSVDLYPLRAEGLGNLNFGFQNGDTLFVALAHNQVQLEGGFTRVVATVPGRVEMAVKSAPGDVAIKPRGRADQRVAGDAESAPNELKGQPIWLSQWLLEGKAPTMEFEMLPGETMGDALRFAGGFALTAFSGSVTLRRVTATGSLSEINVPAGAAMAKFVLERGDVLTALPLRDFGEGAIQVGGWVRVQGIFARTEGERVGDLLKNLSLVLPDTYMERGELVRTLPDGSKRYLPFNVTKALTGDAAHSLLLESRDAIELYRIGDLRLPRTLTVIGPLTKPGTFEFIEGMRVSDLLFRAGVPLNNANKYVAELAHIREGKTTDVRQLDLGKLLSTEDSSPVDLKDDRVDPLLRPFDQLSIYAKPDFREHRTITLGGQVARPGSYDLENDQTSLRDVIKRAGGLTPEAMPNAGIFLRPMAGLSAEKSRATALSGIAESDPTANGINEILGRLNETKRMPVSGALEVTPLLHRLMAGSLNRLVVDIPGILKGDSSSEVYLMDGDEIIIPRKTEVAYVVGETASPFAAFKVKDGAKVKDLLSLAGGTTPNADTGHIRLLKANGRIIDSWVSSKVVEPGDAVLVPQKISRDVTWQESLTALTPLAILINAVK